MTRKNILIYPCDSNNALEIYDSIRYSLHLNVYGANAHSSIANLYYENEVIVLPKVFDKTFVEELNRVIDALKIDLLFPTHDDVIYFLSQKLDEINTQVIGGDRFINEISRFKKKTYDLFSNTSFVPKIYSSLEDILTFPVFVKPDKGHGSIGALKIENKEEITESLFSTHVISEFLPGKEYTIDCFSDKNNELLLALPRKREIVRNGVSHKNIEADEAVKKECFDIAKQINQMLDFKGLWFFQVKEDTKGRLKLLEICTRAATTMSFARFKGVNLPLLTIFAYLDMDVEVMIFQEEIELYRYSLTKPRYNFDYDEIYIDFDDTIIVNQKVCIDAIAFLYMSKNNGKKINLITKHQFAILETLQKFHISKSLFDRIIVIDMNDNKFDYISNTFSIFIDNFYKERKEVFEKLNIPVFDVEGIKSLLNY